MEGRSDLQKFALRFIVTQLGVVVSMNSSANQVFLDIHVLSSNLPSLWIFATACICTHFNKYQIHRGGIAPRDCGANILQISSDLRDSLILSNYIWRWLMLEGFPRHVKHDKLGL